jgi:hypothetical protein
VGPLKLDIQLGGIGPNGLMPALLITFLGGGNLKYLKYLKKRLNLPKG